MESLLSNEVDYKNMDAGIHLVSCGKLNHPRLIWNAPIGADEECWLLKKVNTTNEFKNFVPIHPNDALGILESVASQLEYVRMTQQGEWVAVPGGPHFPTAVQALAFKFGWKPE